MKILSPTMNISGGAAIISGSAALALIGFLLYRQVRDTERRAVAAEATVEELRAELGQLRTELAASRGQTRRLRRPR